MGRGSGGSVGEVWVWGSGGGGGGELVRAGLWCRVIGGGGGGFSRKWVGVGSVFLCERGVVGLLEDRSCGVVGSVFARGGDSNVEYLCANLNIKGMSNSRRTSLSNVDYMLYPSLLRTVTDWKGKPSLRSTERSLLHDNIIPKPDLALELGKSISLTEAEEEAVAREVHATHARIVSGPDPEPMQEDQTGSNSGKLHVSLAGPNPEHMDDELTEAEEETIAREVHATHARIVSGPDL
ncbi:hypothetical protein Tco_1164873 [Tanacetum coccineum]